MIKKTTLLVLLCAAALGAAVYYFDWKKGNEPKPAADASKPAFSFQASDIVAFMLAHPAQPGDSPVRFEKRDGAWRIVPPTWSPDGKTIAYADMTLTLYLADAATGKLTPINQQPRESWTSSPPRELRKPNPGPRTGEKRLAWTRPRLRWIFSSPMVQSIRF